MGTLILLSVLAAMAGAEEKEDEYEHEASVDVLAASLPATLVSSVDPAARLTATLLRERLVAKRERLLDERPDFGTPIALMASSGSVAFLGLGFMTASDCWRSCAPVSLGAGLVVLAAHLALGLAGWALLPLRIQARARNDVRVKDVEAELAALDRWFTPPLR